MMEIQDTTTKSSVSSSSNGVSSDTRPVEIRNYSLDEKRAVKKKLSDADRDIADIKFTDGGVTIKLNTGAYELLKRAAEQFFTSEFSDSHCQYKCQTKTVTDKQGYRVETKFKVSCGKSPIYTFNMYHTQSSCLVNGKQVRQFLDYHLPQLINAIEIQLSSQNTTVSAVNAQLRDLLKESTQSPENASTKKDKCDNTCTVTENALPNSKSVTSPTEVSPIVTIPPDAELHTNKHDKLLESIVASIASLNDTLVNHMHMTDRNFSIIRDEIQSVKSQMSCNKERESVQIDELCTSADVLKDVVSNNYDSLTRRLQQITDLVKTLPTKLPRPQSTGSNIDKEQPKDGPVSAESRASKNRERTLIVGDSLLKGINPVGLSNNVEVSKLSGAKVLDISREIQSMESGNYGNVVVHVGGNDICDGNAHETTCRELRTLTDKLLDRDYNVYLCTVCPRQDVDVRDYNTGVRQICQDTGAGLIDCYQEFVNGTGETVRPFFNRDGIHLSVNGSRTLVAAINRHVQIVRKRNNESKSVSQPSHISKNRKHNGQNGYRSNSYRQPNGNRRFNR